MSLIPDKTPDGREIEAVGVHSSGGIDSSILLHNVAKEAKKRGIKVYALCVRRPKPSNPIFAKKVVNKINELLKTNVELIVYYPEIETDEQKIYVDEYYMADQNMLNFSNDLYQLSLSGQTTNPTVEEQQKHFTEMSKLDHIRGVDVPKNTERFFTMQEAIDFTKNWSGLDYQLEGPLDLSKHVWSMRPYYNLNKKDLAKMYEDQGLMDSLFPVTRSCEDDNLLTGHCGKCWWCCERKWAFGKC